MFWRYAAGDCDNGHDYTVCGNTFVSLLLAVLNMYGY